MPRRGRSRQAKMNIVHSVAALGGFAGTGLTIGNFDGLHLGHQALVRRTLDVCRLKGLTPVIMTFWPHPRQVLFPDRGHVPLTSREDRLSLLEGMGVPHVLELPFTRELASLDAADFARTHFAPMRLRHLVVGHDFSLGRDRGGQVPVLRQLGGQWSFAVERLEAVAAGEGLVVSSTALRQLIVRGDVAQAAKLLGRCHSFCGEVVHGEGRGRTLGFPTANLRCGEVVLPAEGVYATRAHVNGHVWPAATSIGHKPSFGGTRVGVETFLLEGGQDLYGCTMRLEFVERLRAERRFASVEALVRQIADDVVAARNVLAAGENASGAGFLPCA